MKKLKLSLVAILAIIAATGSSFTSTGSDAANTLYYFSNTLAKASPTNNDFDFRSTVNPGPSHCNAGTPICYGSSTTPQDMNGHPTSAVTSVLIGVWK